MTFLILLVDAKPCGCKTQRRLRNGMPSNALVNVPVLMNAELPFPALLLPVGQVTRQIAALPDPSRVKGRGGGISLTCLTLGRRHMFKPSLSLPLG